MKKSSAKSFWISLIVLIDKQLKKYYLLFQVSAANSILFMAIDKKISKVRFFMFYSCVYEISLMLSPNYYYRLGCYGNKFCMVTLNGFNLFGAESRIIIVENKNY